MEKGHLVNSNKRGDNYVTPQQCGESFQRLLMNIQQTDWKTYLAQTVKKYSLDSYKLTQLKPKNIQTLYLKISLKYKNKECQRMVWYQNELRLFIWFLATSQGLFHLSPINYKQEQLKQLSKPFYGIHEDLFQYQYKFAICPQLYRQWEFDENQLLSDILKKYQKEGQWSNVAKQLFLLSNKKFFRTPQTCRQRWQNHLDNRKVRGNWTPEEDFLLVKNILSEGKRWSIIAKKIGDTRTQHMVKNRFQTLLRREYKSKKKPTRFSEQFQFCKQLLKKLSQKTLVEQLYHNSKVQEEKQIKQQTQQINFLRSDQLSDCSQQKLPLIKIQTIHSAQQQFAIESYLSFIDFKEEQKQQKEIDYFDNKMEIPSFFDEYDIYYKNSMCKMTTQLQLQVPLFMDETLFGNEEYYENI